MLSFEVELFPLLFQLTYGITSSLELNKYSEEALRHSQSFSYMFKLIDMMLKILCNIVA